MSQSLRREDAMTREGSACPSKQRKSSPVLCVSDVAQGKKLADPVEVDSFINTKIR